MVNWKWALSNLLCLSCYLNQLIQMAKNRSWVKRRSASRYFNNIICELMIEDKMVFKEKFRLSVEGFEFVLKHTDDSRSLANICKYSIDVSDVGWKPLLNQSNIKMRKKCWMIVLKQKFIQHNFSSSNMIFFPFSQICTPNESFKSFKKHIYDVKRPFHLIAKFGYFFHFNK